MLKKTLFQFFIVLPFALAFSAVQAQEVSLIEKESASPAQIPTKKKGAISRFERTQIFWQPWEDHNAISITAGGSVNAYTDVTNTGAAANIVTEVVPTGTIYYSYGISRLWALTLAFSTSPKQTQNMTPDGTVTTTSTGGPDDVVVTFKNTTPFSKWNLHYGLNLNMSLDLNQPARIDSQGNNYSGGDGLMPYAGTSFNIFAKSFLGLKAQYFYRGPRIIDPNRNFVGAQQKTGGHVATGILFFEWHTFPWLIDFRSNLIWTGEQDITVLSTFRTVSGYSSFTESLGLQYFFSPRTMLRLDGTLSQIPQIAITAALTQNSHAIYGGTLSFRNEF